MGNETLAQRGSTRYKAPLLMKATVLPTCCSNVRCVVANNLKSKIVCVGSSGKCPRFCAICTPYCGRKGKCCVYSLAKVSIFFRSNRVFLQQKVRAFRIQSSVVENLRTFFSFFPCFSAEPPFFERSPPLFRSVPLPSSPFCSPVALTRPARSRL